MESRGGQLPRGQGRRRRHPARALRVLARGARGENRVGRCRTRHVTTASTTMIGGLRDHVGAGDTRAERGEHGEYGVAHDVVVITPAPSSRRTGSRVRGAEQLTAGATWVTPLGVAPGAARVESANECRHAKSERHDGPRQWRRTSGVQRVTSGLVSDSTTRYVLDVGTPIAVERQRSGRPRGRGPPWRRGRDRC